MSVSPPVRPADPLLRLRGSENFSWRVFETFAEQLILALTGKRPIRYGKPGEKQDGIDCYVDVDEATRWTFQFRQVEDFTERTARSVVKETKFEGQKHFVFVACEVGTAVRDYFDRLPDWEIWDIRDISLYVRTMPAETGRRLVYQFFGNDWVKNFFDGSVVASCVSANLFFAPGGQRDFLRHDLPLIGRAGQVEELGVFIDSEAVVALISGRGGIGKSRLLRELTALRGSYELRYVMMADLTVDSVGDLPLEPTIIVIDDVHDREDLKVALEIVRQRPIPTKLVLATRSHAIDDIRSQLSRAGFGLDQIREITPLEELHREETKTVIRAIIGSGHEEIVSVLAQRVADSPILTVLASRLLQLKALNPAALASDADVRFLVFERFRNEMLGRVTEIDSSLVRELVTLVAALGPVTIEDPNVRQAMASFLHVEEDQLVRATDSLAAAGVLRRRGTRVRVTPEVLSDFILEQACVTRAGKPTGYATRVFRDFKEVWGARLLRNLGEVDWRVRGGKQSSELLDSVWNEIGEDFRSGSIVQRSGLLLMVNKVAGYQPAQALRLVETAIRQPIATTNEMERSFKLGPQSVMRRLPPILREIAFNLEFVPRVARLLWELGRDDKSATNSNTEHAFRLLTEMAKPGRRKPVEFQEAVVDAAVKWLREPDIHDHEHSVLDLFGAALARQGTAVWAEEAASFRVAEYLIPPQRAAALHDRGLVTLMECLNSERIDVAGKAAKILGDYARRLRIDGVDVDTAIVFQQEWKPGRLRALSALHDIACTTTEPLLALEILDDVEWLASNDDDAEVGAAAKAIVDSVLSRSDLEETLLVIDGWGNRYQLHDHRVTERSMAKEQKVHHDRLAAAAPRFIQRYAPGALLEFLEGRLVTAEKMKVSASPGPLIACIAKSDELYAEELLDLLAVPDHPLSSWARVILIAIAERDERAALAFAERGIESGQPALGHAAAGLLSTQTAELSTDYKRLFERLVHHRDASVRLAALQNVRWALKANAAFVANLLPTIEMDGDGLIAKEIAELFNKYHVPVSELPPAVVRSIVQNMCDLPTLDDHWTEDFLAEAMLVEPKAVVDMLLGRIARRDNDSDDEAVPFQFHTDHAKLTERDDYEDIIRSLRDALLPYSIWTSHYIPLLFSGIADVSHPKTLAVLEEWLISSDEEKIGTAARLLSGVNGAFIFHNREWVGRVLDHAWSLNEECYQRVSASFFTAVITEMRTGSHGQPFPQDLAMRANALKAMSALEPHSPAWRFYESIAKHAEGDIERKRLMDEDEDEEYLD